VGVIVGRSGWFWPEVLDKVLDAGRVGIAVSERRNAHRCSIALDQPCGRPCNPCVTATSALDIISVTLDTAEAIANGAGS